MNTHTIGDIILDEASIAAGVRNVAAQISQDYTDAVVITVVPGGFSIRQI